MSWLLLLKLAIIIIFLIMFLRRPSVTWGVGLLTVTSAVLLDALLGAFNGEALRAELGFFYFVIAGTLFAGAAVWLWGTLLPFISPIRSIPSFTTPARPAIQGNGVNNVAESDDSAIDRQMLYQEISERFGREDVLDLMFDLNINESDVMTVDQSMNALISNIIENARNNGQTSALALAVERILTPVPPSHLPRLEKISSDSPPTILRQYLMAHYNMHDLEQMATELGIDWEQLDAGAKKEKVRSLLQYLYRRNRISELVDLMHERGPVEDSQA
jgi:hypothetical protein